MPPAAEISDPIPSKTPVISLNFLKFPLSTFPGNPPLCVLCDLCVNHSISFSQAARSRSCPLFSLSVRPPCEKFHNLFMAHVKLHIPGPVEVSEKTFQAFRSPMIGHRGQGFKDLYGKIQPQLQQLFYTNRLVYLSTSSAWGVMEGAIRNLVAKKVLNCMCGAFSDKWLDVSKKCGKEAEALQVDWGSPIRAEQIDAKLSSGQFDALTLIHNETSTGVMSPLQDI